MYPTKGRGMRLWRYQGANALGQRPRTLYLSLALWNVKKSYKNKRKFGESKKSRIFVVLKETKVSTILNGIIKNKDYEK